MPVLSLSLSVELSHKQLDPTDVWLAQPNMHPPDVCEIVRLRHAVAARLRKAAAEPTSQPQLKPMALE